MSGGRKREPWLDVDSACLLWLTRLVDAPRADTIALQTEYRSQYEAPGEGTVPLVVRDRLLHSIVEVIDPDNGTRLTTLQLPFRAVRVSAGYIGRLTEDDDGFIVTRIYTLRLLRSPHQSASSETRP